MTNDACILSRARVISRSAPTSQDAVADPRGSVRFALAPGARRSVRAARLRVLLAAGTGRPRRATSRAQRMHPMRRVATTIWSKLERAHGVVGDVVLRPERVEFQIGRAADLGRACRSRARGSRCTRCRRRPRDRTCRESSSRAARCRSKLASARRSSTPRASRPRRARGSEFRRTCTSRHIQLALVDGEVVRCTTRCRSTRCRRRQRVGHPRVHPHPVVVDVEPRRSPPTSYDRLDGDREAVVTVRAVAGVRARASASTDCSRRTTCPSGARARPPRSARTSARTTLRVGQLLVEVDRACATGAKRECGRCRSACRSPAASACRPGLRSDPRSRRAPSSKSSNHTTPGSSPRPTSPGILSRTASGRQRYRYPYRPRRRRARPSPRRGDRRTLRALPTA